MKIKNHLVVFFAGCFIAWAQAEVKAEKITTNLDGIVQNASAYGDAGSPESWGISAGDPFKITLTYDTNATSSGEVYYFNNITSPEFSLVINTNAIPNPLKSEITIQNNAPGGLDQFHAFMHGYFMAYGTYDSPWDLNVFLNDSSGTAFSDTSLPDLLSLSSFSGTNVTFSFLMNRSSFSSGQVTNFGGLNIQGSITSIEQTVVVPEPSTILMFLSGLFGMCWFRKK